MINIEITNELRAEIEAMTLPPVGTAATLTEAALLAEKALKFYQQAVPEKFADHNSEFFRERKHALELGRATDAFECLTAFRSHTTTLQNAPATPENVAWLKNIFDCALCGQLHLRKLTTKI